MASDFISQLISCARAATVRAIAIIFFSVLFLACSAYGQSMPGLQAPDKPKVKDDRPAAVKAARGEVPFNRMYGHLKPGVTKIKRLGHLTESEKKKNQDKKFLRIGVVRSLATPLDPQEDSELYTVTEGCIRVAGVASEGAVGVRLQFKDMSLPPGARVFVYSANNPTEFFGPYEGRGPSGDGTFWTPAIQGDTAVIEYFTPSKGTLAKPPFKIVSIGHIYKDMAGEPQGDNSAAGSCELEVTSSWQDVAKSVGRIDFISGPFLGTCTGTLLNNVGNDQKPYFLTANHCISTQTEAQTATVYWNYTTGDEPNGSTPQTHGANLLVTGTSSDFSLLLLTGTMPGGLFFSGWDSTAFSSQAAATGIHHPEGSHKRISFGTAKQPLAGNCSGTQCLRVDWSSGVTEPGSSGSGIWIGDPSDPNGPRLIGNLIGGESACGGAPSTMWDVYGRFSVTYPSVAPFLENIACVTSLSSSSQLFTSAGGTGSFNVNAAGSCNWNAVSTNGFVTVTSGANGSGNGTVNFSVASNNGVPRSATIVVGGQVFTVNQSGGGACAPTPISIGQTVNGTLATSDCPLGNGTFYDPYSFTVTAGQQIAISMSSGEFDTFLILNKPNGSVLTTDDDGGGGFNSRIPSTSGFITLTEAGTYTIWANAFDPEDTTGTYSLTLSAPIPRTLTVASSNPNSGIAVQVMLVDNNGESNGTTPFTRTYNEFAGFTLIAPAFAPGDRIFSKWLRDGADWSTSNNTSVTMDVDHTLTAVYVPKPTFVLTVASTNPSSGVPIFVRRFDNGTTETATTQFTRTYNQSESIELTAPSTVGNSFFIKWQRDGVDLATTVSAVTNITSNQTMTAVYVAVTPQPNPPPAPTPGGPAVSYQINPAHTGSQEDSITPPLMQRWSRDLGSAASYPLIVNGRVFVIAGTNLYALNSTNGTTMWGPIDVGGSPRGAAYDSGRVITVNRDGLVRAFDAATGTQAWSQQLQGQSFSAPPTATGGTAYVNSFSTLYALNVSDGTIKWSTANAGGEQSSPAVTFDRLYVTYPCRTLALSPFNGGVLWTQGGPCGGGGGRTPVFYNERIYARDPVRGGLTLDSGTGTQVSIFDSIPTPAFHGTTGFFLTSFGVEARDIFTRAPKWSFAGDLTLSSPPIVVNGVVYVGSTSGKLYALDENTGTNIWTGIVGAPVNRPDEFNASVPLTGLSAAEALLVVPASNLVVAYQTADVTTPPVIYAEDGTSNAAAVYSVSFVRGPFAKTNPNNLSTDQRTRIILFTSSLGLSQADLADPSVLVVELAGVNLPVENVGAATISGLSSSYIVVRLPDNAPTGPQELRVKLRGAASAPKMLTISP